LRTTKRTTFRRRNPVRGSMQTMWSGPFGSARRAFTSSLIRRASRRFKEPAGPPGAAGRLRYVQPYSRLVPLWRITHPLRQRKPPRSGIANLMGANRPRRQITLAPPTAPIKSRRLMPTPRSKWVSVTIHSTSGRPQEDSSDEICWPLSFSVKGRPKGPETGLPFFPSRLNGRCNIGGSNR
jgi:hypothetical protein